jgi:DNA-binding HxlR family transcriptional regulator
MVSIPEHGGKICDRFHTAVELIGRRWTGAILSSLLAGATRFSEIRDSIPGISDRLIAERLKELEEQRIVVRQVTPNRPPQVSYQLTPKGQALGPVLDGITSWSHDWE